eukprot:262577-Rhodomonas_salina.1
MDEPRKCFHADNSPVDHKIDTQGLPPPPVCTVRVPEHLKDELKKQIHTLLQAGLIRPSSSPYAAPVLFAQKKLHSQFTGWLMCIDYSSLNKQTVKDKFQLPNTEDLFVAVKGSKFFTKLDLKWGFWQVRVHGPDVHKNAFCCAIGHFKWLVGPLGLTNMPPTFQRFV